MVNAHALQRLFENWLWERENRDQHGPVPRGGGPAGCANDDLQYVVTGDVTCGNDIQETRRGFYPGRDGQQERYGC